MFLFHTALMSEGRVLIDRYGLKAQRTDSGVRLFRSESKKIALTVSGVGRVRAASAVSFAAAFLRDENGSPPFVLNFGVCGAADPGKPPGAVFVVRKCTAVATGRDFYPDILFSHDLPEAELHTFDEVVDSRQDALRMAPSVELVDMEAAGVFEAASLLVAPSRTMAAKVVGDSLDDAWNVTAADVAERMNAAMPAVADFVECYRGFAARAEERRLLSPEDERCIAAVREELRLTRAQADRLDDAARFFRASGGESLDRAVAPFSGRAPEHKREREENFGRLIEALHGK